METTDTISQSVKNFIMNEFLPGEDPEELSYTTELFSSGILDSIATLKIVIFLEEAFSITLEPQEASADHMGSIDLITQLVRSKATVE